MKTQVKKIIGNMAKYDFVVCIISIIFCVTSIFHQDYSTTLLGVYFAFISIFDGTYLRKEYNNKYDNYRTVFMLIALVVAAAHLIRIF